MNKILGSPCKVGKIEIKNRTVLEPMGNGLSELDGGVSPEEIAYYVERAKGGVGLVITETASVDSVTGRANPRNLCVDRDELIPGYKKLADAVHEAGSTIFVEIYHPGRQGMSMFNGNRKMFAPSEIECQAVHQPVVAMTIDDIKTLQQKFVEGAVRMQKAGIDGVEVHCAHGYLLNQFLSPYTNKRDDEYGGSPENRARFILDIIKGIREACGPDYPIAVRFSANEYLDYNGLDPKEGITLELSTQYAKMFEAAGADLLDVSAGIYETMNVAWEPTGFEQGWKSELAREIKKVVSVPVICTALIRDPAYAEQLLEAGDCDFVGSARAYLADPAWAAKAIAGEDDDIRQCISCLNCMKGLMATGVVKCAVNPQGCMEVTRSDIKKDGNGRVVAVIGAGPAGLEAAKTLAIRGFAVTLFEKNAEGGGALLQAAKPPHKDKICAYIKYMKGQMDKLGVKVVLNCSPTPDDIAKLDPYAVFVAAGASPVVPRSIPGIMGENIYSVEDVLMEKVDLSGKTVAVIGGGMTGLETAEYLAAHGSTVSIFEMLPEVARGEHFQNIIDIQHRIGMLPQNVNHKLTAIEDGKCFFEKEDGTKVEFACDAVVTSMGMRPNTEFAEQFASFPNFKVLGTNVQYSSIAPATESGFMAAYELA